MVGLFLLKEERRVNGTMAVETMQSPMVCVKDSMMSQPIRAPNFCIARFRHLLQELQHKA